VSSADPNSASFSRVVPVRKFRSQAIFVQTAPIVPAAAGRLGAIRNRFIRRKLRAAFYISFTVDGFRRVEPQRARLQDEGGQMNRGKSEGTAGKAADGNSESAVR